MFILITETWIYQNDSVLSIFWANAALEFAAMQKLQIASTGTVTVPIKHWDLWI